MTSKLKTDILVNDSNVADGTPADAAIWNLPYTNSEDELRAGRASVSAADTHVKHLEDAIKGVSGQFAVTKQNTGANEELSLNLDATGVPNGYNPTANGAGGWAWAAAGGGGAAPVDIMGTAGENLALRDFVYLEESTNTWFKIDTDATPVKCGRFRGVVNIGAISAAASGSIRMIGEVAGFSSLTAGLPVYASTTAGAITQTRPSPVIDSSQIGIVEIGLAVSSTNILVYPSRGIAVQYMRRANLANNATLTLQHHPDAMGHSRRLYAYIGGSEAGAVLIDNPSSNQDTDTLLESTAITGYTADQCTGGTPLGNMTDGGGLAGAFDNSAGTSAIKVSSTTGQIGYDFGSNKTIMQYTVSASGGAAANAWTLQYSTDNVTYNTADTRSAQTAWAGEVRTFNVSTPNTARYWRLNITANNGGANTSVIEIEMKEAIIAEYDKIAQTITFGATQNIGAAIPYLKKVGSPTGTATLRIETIDGSNNPTGTLAHVDASITFSESALGTSYADQVLTFASSFSLAAGTYALVLSTTRAASATNYISWGSDASAPSYSGGEMKAQASSVWSNLSRDAIFRVIAPGTTFSEPAVTGSWSGGTRDIALRYDDGAGADGSIKSTGKNVKGSLADITLVAEIH